MPKLHAFLTEFEDVAEAFHLFGVHEPVPGSLDSVRSAARNVAREIGRSTALLPDLILDKEQGGMFHRYNPEGLGDMVLVDPNGDVHARGDDALAHLRRELTSARAAIAKRKAALEAATDAAAIDEAVKALYALGFRAAGKAAASFAAAAPIKQAKHVLAAVVRYGGEDGRALVVGEGGVRSENAKRQALAFEVVEAQPHPGFVGVLLSLIENKKTKAKLVCRVLEVAAKCDAESSDVAQAVMARSADKKNTSVRRCCADLLGLIGTEEAKTRLLEMLDKDRAASVRRYVIGGLARIGGDDIRARITEASTSDKAKTVREAAAKVLAAWKGD